MPLASGTKLGPYETQALLGAGGMGEVYKARDTRLGRDVAIKILPQHLSTQFESKERFEREARAISSLNHPRICTLHDVGHQDGVHFLVMEYLEGQSLSDRLKKGPVPLKELLKIGIEVCEALEVAHRAGIIHRDLKPGNIMLTKSGAKQMDFGLAKAAMEGADGKEGGLLLSSVKTMSAAGSPISPLTTAGAVLGTIQYMSPEQIEGRPADARSDLFALGTVLYEAATGKRPFEGKSQISVASAILEKEPEPISAIQPLTPPGLEYVVKTCMAKNPDDRFQSAHDVKLQLQWIAREPALGKEPSATAVEKKKSLAAVIPWILAGVLALLAAGAFFLANREQPQPHFTAVTYREGTLENARFSHDGQTIVYSGQWEDDPPQVSLARVGSPESRPLGIGTASLAAISSSDQLAVLLGCDPIFLIDCGGTLAIGDLAGGSPRPIAQHVAYADWTPDGKQLVISVFSSQGTRLEFPPGHVLIQQNAGWFREPRFSPDGKLIAFENHPSLGDDTGSLDIVDLNGNHKVLVPFNVSLEGLAWSPNGKEVWYGGAQSGGWADTLYAVDLSGKTRAILTMPYLHLHDVSSDGRVLLAHETWGRQLYGFFPGDKAQHPYSWLDDTQPTAITDDGRFISFMEAGETYDIAQDWLSYYRATDGSPAVALGAGHATLSPDGKFVVWTSAKSHELQIQPIGPGEARRLPTPGLKTFDHLEWSDDGKHVGYLAQTDQGDWNVYTQSLDAAGPTLLMRGSRNAFPIMSSDGSIIALHGDSGGLSLYHANGSPPLPLASVKNSEFPIRFTQDGKSLLVYEWIGNELVMNLVDLSDGQRRFWKSIETKGSAVELPLVITPDLKYYAFSHPRDTSDLYIVSNVK